MALNIKNKDVERLAAEVATLTGETKTEAVRRALEERKARVSLRVTAARRREQIQRFLEREIWSEIPADQIGRRPSRRERESVLGYGSEGV
jgi:antitoxin VapB